MIHLQHHTFAYSVNVWRKWGTIKTTRIFIIDNGKLFDHEKLEAAFHRHLMAFEVTTTGRRMVCLCNLLARPGVLHPKTINGKIYITEKDSADVCVIFVEERPHVRNVLRKLFQKLCNNAQTIASRQQGKRTFVLCCIGCTSCSLATPSINYRGLAKGGVHVE